MIQRPSVLETEDEEMNLTPLLDCIFNLLFFFLLATTLRDTESRLQVNLPHAASSPSERIPQTVEVIITGSGDIVISGETIDRADLDQALTTLTAGQRDKPVEVLSDAQAPMQSFVDVVTALSRLGIPFTNLRTQPESAPGRGP